MSSSPPWTATAASAPATQAVKPWVRGVLGLSLPWGAELQELMQEMHCTCSFSLGVAAGSSVHGCSAEKEKAQGNVSLALGDGSRFSSQMECFLHFSPL